MATFALVHGAWHGAWCWERLTPLLQQAGHDVVAMDLPIDDVSKDCDDFADVICSALDACDDDIVVVGHSYGGFVIPLVAARRPVRHLVYLCAYMAKIGHSVDDQLRDEPGIFNPAVYGALKLDVQARNVWVDYGLARELIYADCDEPTAKDAFERIRPQATHANTVACSLTEYPSVPSTSIVCTDDKALRLEWAKRIASARPGAELVELPGSHSPFLSRPQVLADVLLRIANGGVVR
jgi:pimeloyl-ACP methyl ester carboxylesterase